MRILPIMQMTIRPTFPEKNIDKALRFSAESSCVILKSVCNF